MYEFNICYYLYVLLSLARVLGLHLVSLDYFLQIILEQSSKMISKFMVLSALSFKWT